VIILQAIKKHQFVNVLDSPGDADLSAHVDFSALKHVVQECAGEYIPDYETNLCSEHSHLICEHVGNINTFESFLITSTCYIVC
jgi:Fe2+ or Zn2+ uptake regulation protein